MSAMMDLPSKMLVRRNKLAIVAHCEGEIHAIVSGMIDLD